MATKTTIKSLFKAIRHRDLPRVAALVAKDPSFVNACAMAPPKKDDGQAPLQVALKTGGTAIADWLIDHGADVNFMETSAINTWRAPALHDAIRAAMFTSNSEDFGAAIAVLERMIAAGADPNATDSYGNSCLTRALLDARIQTRPAKPEPFGTLIESNVRRVFSVLFAGGADRTKSAGHGTFESMKADPVGRFLSGHASGPPRSDA